ncbi:MAG: methyltransferase domain-containing protein [Acidobacteria bacterium]|nr:methyltransferase domain-containing protein [Acidobacteriota bacterium]
MMKGALYDQLWIHRQMLQDRVRCEAYRRAIADTVKTGDVVLDMGTGTGILSLFAARAGARKVYAIERTSIVDLARRLVRINRAEEQIEILQGDMENMDLPEQVDVIISEWMGPYGVDENLLPSVLIARDRWLKPGGKMLPERVTAWMAPAWDSELAREMSFFQARPYDLDLSLITRYTAQEVWYAQHHISLEHLLAEPQPMWTTNVCECSLEEARGPFQALLSFSITHPGKLNALAAWFSAELGAGHLLTCAPDAPKTHWGRTVCPLDRALEVAPGTDIAVEFACEPGEPGWSNTRWSVRIGEGDWEHHDQERALI